MKKFLPLFIVIIIIFPILASAQYQPKKEQKRLTHHMSAEEKALFHTVGKGFQSTDPPPGEIRNIAEFDQMEGVLIRYPFGISYELIAGMSEETVVTTIVEDQGEQNYVSNQYQSHGVNMDNVNFVQALSDSYWTRDYGPWYVAFGDDQIGIVDFIYNRPNRPNDNAVPYVMTEYLDIEYFAMDLITAGGNYMTNGLGISSSSDLIWEENPTLTPTEIDEMVEEYIGVYEYHVLDDPNNTYIDHIDCWGKFLDVDKVLIREVPASHPQYDEIEATAAYYADKPSGYGVPFQVFRVWTPNNEPYTNSLILNDRVFLPITGGQYDDEAIASYQEAMPGYEILGFTGSWESTDALHCRTKGIADRNMLYIDHFPLLGNQPVQTDYEIEAEITAYSGEPVYNDSVKLMYQINGGTMMEIEMTYLGDKLYTATIPDAEPGSQISYIIHAADESGKSIDHPYIGQADPHTFFVGEQLFPAIALDITEIEAFATEGGQDLLSFNLTNNGEIDLTYSISWTTAVFEEFNYDIPNSPNQSAWNYNTYTEEGWTDIEVNDEGEIGDWTIQYTWQTDQYSDESTFLVESPTGTQKTIAAGNSNGNYVVTLSDFNGEEMAGNWKIWIEDSYGDGGHKASNLTMTISRAIEQEEWLTISPIGGTVEPGSQQTIEAICDATGLAAGVYEGNIEITSNDPDSPVISIPVSFEVDIASGFTSNDFPIVQFNNYPNPFSSSTTIQFNLQKSQNVILEIYSYNGQKVISLENSKLNAGHHQYSWEGKDSSGNKMNSGIYFLRIKSDEIDQVNKLILMD